jgi:hypothetical protein
VTLVAEISHGAQAGAGFARGMMEAQAKITAIKRQLLISGRDNYR